MCGFSISSIFYFSPLSGKKWASAAAICENQICLNGFRAAAAAAFSGRNCGRVSLLAFLGKWKPKKNMRKRGTKEKQIRKWHKTICGNLQLSELILPHENK